MRDKLAKDAVLFITLARYSASHASSQPALTRIELPSSVRLLSSSPRSSDHHPDTWIKHPPLDVRESPFNVPNSLSLARGASGPLIAHLILTEQWPLALGATAVSGATDWLDGYLARRLDQSGVLGSYLDPLGDKVLIGSVIWALAYKGLVPTWVAAVVIGRDVALVAGLVIMRWRALRASRDKGEARGPITMVEFCRTRCEGPIVGVRPSEMTHEMTEGLGRVRAQGCGDMTHEMAEIRGMGSKNEEGVQGEVRSRGLSIGSGPMPMMEPLMISKVNTCLQLALVGGSLSHAWAAWPLDAGALQSMEVLTAGTTLLTMAAYARKALVK